jgi:glucose/arabinose dehydrogenase
MARQLRFAPDGHLFVASPSMGTTGGSNNGSNAIVVLPDDDHDGVADSNVSFLSSLPATQGLLFTGGYFYFQDLSTIKRVPFKSGDLSPSAAVELVTTITVPQDGLHWTKVLDIAQDGTIYITNGGSQSDTCVSTNPVRGSILKLLPGGGTQIVAKGFRNPISLRCETNHDVCLATELALDYSGAQGGREKILQVHQGDDWGFPCCATQNIPYTGVTYADTHQTPDCSGVQPESAGFIIGETPFGLDFETGKWPAPWKGRVFVTLHGVFGSWAGARVVGVALDPVTGLPLASDDLDGSDSANMSDFALGWDDGHLDHGRPASITFASDGRMFIGDDQQGAVIWIAPVGLMQ